MKILAIDTALNACSVALMDGRTTIAFSHEIRSRGHAEKLLPTIQDLMQGNGFKFADLNSIGVTIGPGTFTGLRIGLAAARAISLTANLPCIGVSTLECLAASVTEAEANGRAIVPLIDARRQEIYHQTFQYNKVDAEFPNPLSDPKASNIDEMLSILPTAPTFIFGSGAELLTNLDGFNAETMTLLEKEPDPDARLVAQIALKKLQKNDFTSPPAPLYLRAPDAKLPGGITPA
jgi:tRNA threonylcarbamoyladenosine biosynthesis protein TsaB